MPAPRRWVLWQRDQNVAQVQLGAGIVLVAHLFCQRVDFLRQDGDAATTELNLSHILIPLPENPTSDQAAEAESQARAIVEQARNGSDFGKMSPFFAVLSAWAKMDGSS